MAFGRNTRDDAALSFGNREIFFGMEVFLDVGTGTGILAIAARKNFHFSAHRSLRYRRRAIEIAQRECAFERRGRAVSFQRRHD